MFKAGREGTGENWAEVVTASIGSGIGLPCAHYEFADYKGLEGTVCKSVVPKNGRLVHGNELLAGFSPGYEKTKMYRQKEYTLLSVLALLKKLSVLVGPPLGFVGPPKNVESCLEVFIGYLMLDALVANQDRHHENWGVITVGSSDFYLAETFDHASSLGRNENDEARKDMVSTKDTRRHISAYVERAKTPFYTFSPPRKNVSTLDAFLGAGQLSPAAAEAWIDTLDLIDQSWLENVFSDIPISLISDVAAEFAVKLVLLNKGRIQKAKGTLR